MTKKKNTGRKPGAQPENKNAIKHGFYSKHFTANEHKRLTETDRHSMEDEMDAIRICIDRLLGQLSFVERKITDAQGNTTRDDHYISQLNTLAIMNQSLSTLERTHYLTRGKGGVIEKTILEAMEELRLEMGW